tara:strand:+ start:252 stop:461 length:210 start_codon:yes stop_codon:yes gene_type:complete
MFTFIYTLLTLLVFSVIILSLYFKLKNLGTDKKIAQSTSTRPWWHYVLLPIVGIISFIGAAALVVILFN